MVNDGYYTLVYPNGEHRTLRIKTLKDGNLEGKTIIGYLNGTDNVSQYKYFGFVSEEGLRFWRKFEETESVERRSRILKAYQTLSENPSEAGKTYALHSGNCFVCNRLLTNPESIEAGIGPECRKSR